MQNKTKMGQSNYRLWFLVCFRVERLKALLPMVLTWTEVTVRWDGWRMSEGREEVAVWRRLGDVVDGLKFIQEDFEVYP